MDVVNTAGVESVMLGYPIAGETECIDGDTTTLTPSSGAVSSEIVYTADSPSSRRRYCGMITTPTSGCWQPDKEQLVRQEYV